MNMSYCRFENTAHDLRDCLNHLRQMKQGLGEKLSRPELEAAQNLACLSLTLLEDLADDLFKGQDGKLITHQSFEDILQLIQDDQGNRGHCENCGEAFTAFYEGQTLCGRAGDDKCVDEDAPEFGQPVD